MFLKVTEASITSTSLYFSDESWNVYNLPDFYATEIRSPSKMGFYCSPCLFKIKREKHSFTHEMSVFHQESKVCKQSKLTPGHLRQ